ncbi:MAG: NTP transferase domain-containing protein [Acidimicrobiia bacterium]|nr:NTP transferase domain-containing protein [Acidimicrobiia bacterium]
MKTGAAGIILAAGASEGLGEPVQLIDVDGRPLLEILVQRLSAWLDPLVVVLGFKAEEVLAEADLGGAAVIINYDWEEGIGSSMRTGLDYLSREKVHRPVLIALANQPGITEEHLRALQTAHAGGVTVPVYRYEPGYPLLVDRSQWDRFMSRGLDPLDIALAHPEWVTEVRGDDHAPRRIVVPTDIEAVLARFGAG